MNIRLITATLAVFCLSQAAQATLFVGNCDVTVGENETSSWEAELNTENEQAVKNLHNLAGASVELAITPGAAAFADVMTVKVTSAKTEFQLMSLLSGTGYGSVIYNGKLDGEKFSLECVVNKIQNEIRE